jgi:hypothetical protein
MILLLQTFSEVLGNRNLWLQVHVHAIQLLILSKTSRRSSPSSYFDFKELLYSIANSEICPLQEFQTH